jgi:hypothetical protein
MVCERAANEPNVTPTQMTPSLAGWRDRVGALVLSPPPPAGRSIGA